MSAIDPTRPFECRTVWISDVHLGTRESRVDYLLNFLANVRCQHLYLVGDIFDFWSMRKGVRWNRQHNALLQTVFGMASNGTRITYIPGNHDEWLREFDGMSFGRIHLQREAIHITRDGRRILVVHGDEFDAAVQCHSVGGLIGSVVYDTLVRFSHYIAVIRRQLGLPYWSLAAYIKQRLPRASVYIDRFDRAVAQEAKHRQVDGLICGHIHRASFINEADFFYANTGDWVESCTALVEKESGSMELVHWSDQRQQVEWTVQPLNAVANPT